MTRPRIDHLGIIVPDLDAAVVRFTAILGGVPELKDLPDVGLRVAEFRAENIAIELLQYYGDGTEGFARDVMGGRPGLNHFSVEVEDIERSAAELAGLGFNIKPGFPRPGAHGTVAFFEDPATGLLFETCQLRGAE